MKYYLLILITSTFLFLSACGGSNSAETSKGAYSGSGIGATRLKTITSSNDTDTWTETYFYDGAGKGRLGSIVSNGNPEGDTSKTFEYNQAGNRLSKVVETGSIIVPLNDEAATYTSEQTINYGSTLFLPTNSPSVDITNSSYIANGSYISANTTRETTYIYRTNIQGATRLEKITGKSIAHNDNEGTLQSQLPNEDTWETSYRYDNNGRLEESSTIYEYEHIQNSNNTAALQQQSIGQSLALLGGSETLPPRLGDNSNGSDETIFTTTYHYNSSNKLESEFRVDNWHGNITHYRTDYLYENEQLKTSKDYIKYIEENPNDPAAPTAPGAQIVIDPNPFVSTDPVNQWILKNTNTYHYESGDCYYHYPDTGYFKSTDLQSLCPR